LHQNTRNIDPLFKYWGAITPRQLDVANLNDYDVILGTPWIYQHQVCIGLNPARILIGSDESMPIHSDSGAKPLLNAMLPDSEVKRCTSTQ
jgi:hypothetical protein